MKGCLSKMHVTLDTPVSYSLSLNDTSTKLNPYLGEKIKLTFTGNIACVHCKRSIKKTFGQGYCFPCFRQLAQCDLCILKPETCHFAAGTCREPQWGLSHCFTPHIVYLANTAGIKVGLTRKTQVPTRWIDQGAIQALPIIETPNRFCAGLIEVLIAQSISDKTNWRALLKGPADRIDLEAKRDELLQTYKTEIEKIAEKFEEPIRFLENESTVDLEFPMLEYPEKIKTHNFDKTPILEGKLMGIKGQYLFFEQTVINIRKFTGYEITFT